MKILRPVLAGIIIGTALFFMPFFVLRIAVFFLIIFSLIRLFSWGRYRGGYRRPFYPAFDNIRNMSDEEYQQFKESYGRACGDRKADTENKTEQPD